MKDLQIGNRIDVDGNLMAYASAQSRKRNIGEVIQDMALKLRDIAHSGGFVVQIVIDGDVCPDCKRATWQRKKEKKLQDINRRYCRLKALELHGKIEGGDSDLGTKENYKSFNAEAMNLE